MYGVRVRVSVCLGWGWGVAWCEYEESELVSSSSVLGISEC